MLSCVNANVCYSRQHEVGFKYSAPNTPTERTLVEVFESILHVSPVGVDDDFFALGGNSLLGVSLIGALEGKAMILVKLVASGLS